MRRRLASLAAVAALGLAGGACGSSQKEGPHPEPSGGDGSTRAPDVPVESVNALRTAELTIENGRFKPRLVTIRLDNSVKLINKDKKRYDVDARPDTGGYERARIRPGTEIERSFLEPGRYQLIGKGEPGLRATVVVSQGAS